jgi:hypothetical protein
MCESVERAGKEKTERIFLIRKVVRPQLERERRFEDAESAARPCASQESDCQGACHEIHVNDSGDLLREGCVLVERQMSDEGCLIRQR